MLFLCSSSLCFHLPETMDGVQIPVTSYDIGSRQFVETLVLTALSLNPGPPRFALNPPARPSAHGSHLYPPPLPCCSFMSPFLPCCSPSVCPAPSSPCPHGSPVRPLYAAGARTESYTAARCPLLQEPRPGRIFPNCILLIVMPSLPANQRAAEARAAV